MYVSNRQSVGLRKLDCCSRDDRQIVDSFKRQQTVQLMILEPGLAKRLSYALRISHLMFVILTSSPAFSS